MKNSNDYFAKRIANSYWDTFNGTNKDHKKLIQIYKRASDDVLKELYKLETDFSENGVISRSKVYKANHLKKISEQYKNVLKDLGEKVESTGELTILKAGKDIVATTSDLLKNVGIAIKYNPNTAKKLYQKPWRGANFSGRVWKNQNKLHKELNDILTKGIITGKPTAQMAMELNSRMNTGLHNASRLIRSETMHQMNEINKVSMKESGVTKVQEIVTLDERTSSECSPHNKKIHDIDKAPILPRHPNCRCVLVPYIDVDKVAEEFNRREKEILGENDGLDEERNIEKTDKKGYNISYKEVDNNIEKILQKQSDKIWNKKLSGSEQNALYEYSGTDYGIINRYLDNRLFDDDNIEWNQTPQKIKELDRALSRSTLGDDLVLHRGVGFREFESWKNSDTIKAYKSTSINENILDVFCDGYHIIIRAPKDTKGFYLGNYSEHKSEKEFLMMRNQKYKILSIDGPVMEVEFYG